MEETKVRLWTSNNVVYSNSASSPQLAFFCTYGRIEGLLHEYYYFVNSEHLIVRLNIEK